MGVSTLQLVEVTRSGVSYDSGVSRSERHFLDFVIDGQSLWERIAKPRDLISVICFEYRREETAKALGRLLLVDEAVIPGERRAIFICSECGDLGCGALTAVVAREEPFIIWRDFGFQNDYEESISFDGYRTVGPYKFDFEHYKSVLVPILKSQRLRATD
jgi:hypothetical protein